MFFRKKSMLEKARDKAFSLTRGIDKKQLVVFTGLTLFTLFTVRNKLMR